MESESKDSSSQPKSSGENLGGETTTRRQKVEPQHASSAMVVNRSANQETDAGPADGGRRKAVKGCLKKALKFAFSQFGLCAMVTLYAIAGGFIFQHLEKTNEKQQCIDSMRKYYPMENATVFRLWDIASSYQDKDDAVVALDSFQKQLQSFRDDVLALQYDGANCSAMGEPGGPQYQWSYPGALLFSVTVFTTIGYGNIAPKTFWGRLVCIAYAVLGIPLMLLCLANLGEVMANIFRFVYARVCCCGYLRNRLQARSEFESRQNLTDEGLDDPWKMRYDVDRHQMTEASPSTSFNQDDVDDDDDFDDDDDDEEDLKITVPLTITMALVGGYLFMGSLLFGVWEDWDWLKAAYYCFVTIATIGFGDVVPGSVSFDSSGDQWKMIGATVYIVFGMAIMSMAFNLIQEEIVSKFTWVADKLGILEKNKDEMAEEEEATKVTDRHRVDGRQTTAVAPVAKSDPTPPLLHGIVRNRKNDLQQSQCPTYEESFGKADKSISKETFVDKVYQGSVIRKKDLKNLTPVEISD